MSTASEDFVARVISGEEALELPPMKIQLAPGQRLIVGFYDPACNREPNGWSPPEDHDIDGEFTIEYRPDAIVVSADMPDDEHRTGIIYQASNGCDDSDAPDEALEEEIDPRYGR